MSSAPGLRRHIVVDMTPLGPGGENGGAGLVATSLLENLSDQDTASHYTLLTAETSHAELAPFERANVVRNLAVHRRGSRPIAARILDRALPASLRVPAKRAYRSFRPPAPVENNADLLFCPFTVPTFWRPGMACVSIVYDLQHLAYPRFFTAEQRLNRQHHVTQALRRSRRLVAISEYVRQTLLEKMGADPAQVVTIPLGVLHSPVAPDASVLGRFGLIRDQFVLYPANFWPHKNHQRLIDAVRLYHENNPAVRLRLVCTGAPNALMHELSSTSPRDLVIFAEYVSASELSALYEATRAVVFPSLYEGFGMPVLEALHHGKPVLCSDLPVLREVAGDCATYFDPNSPAAIARALEHSPTPERAASRRARAALFGDGGTMAARYLAVFNEVLSVRNAA